MPHLATRLLPQKSLQSPPAPAWFGMRGQGSGRVLGFMLWVRGGTTSAKDKEKTDIALEASRCPDLNLKTSK